ncbi:hypothetical protein [Demequina silvatica]|uniref:hypothetical protein n=1 Tax=Demequina silvatica TaxID=1638988 RepID=UPI0007832313|nr:hypothetical protein [Demequina silvatica]
MSFEELFNPGLAHTREQKNLDKVRPATEVVGEAPPRDDAVAGIEIPSPEQMEPFPEKRRGPAGRED